MTGKPDELLVDDPASGAVVIAAYNEAEMIHGVVAEARAVFPWVVVVDDSSDDETARLALSAGATVLRHPVNLGQGAALQTGITYAMSMGASFVVTYDADGQHDPADARRMLQELVTSSRQVALGSRFLGSTAAMPFTRRLLLKAATLFTRLTTGLRLTDAHNGLRVLRSDAALAIELKQNRMAHASEILDEIASKELTYLEVPVHIKYTAYSLAKGQSSLGAVNILVDLLLARLRK